MISRSLRRSIVWFLLLLALAGCKQQSKSVPADETAGASAMETMQVIEGRVSDLRGLAARKAVSKAFLNTAELRQKMTDDLLQDYSEQEARDDVLFYVAFELMKPDVDLYKLLIDVQTEQVAGFYDPDTEELYVVTGAEELGALERMTFAHEYTHALQDQHFDLQALGFTDEGETKDEDSERQFAVRSLVEGDATLLMQQYALQYFQPQDLQEILKQSEATDSSVLDSAPEVVRESLLFPYSAGLIFVSALFQNGGWSAIDAAYANPPVSTEQILHPERYPDDVPQIVALPPLTDTLGAGWHLVDTDVMGEFGLRLYLEVHIDPTAAEVAADGWAGDRYAVHWRDDESAFVLALRSAWDTPTDAAEFLDSYAEFAGVRFGSGPARSEGEARRYWFGADALLLARNDDGETLVLIAPDEATLSAIHALFPDF